MFNVSLVASLILAAESRLVAELMEPVAVERLDPHQIISRPVACSGTDHANESALGSSHTGALLHSVS